MKHIQYPALFCYAGADEMLRLNDAVALQNLLVNSHALLPDADYIIDSLGLEWLVDNHGRTYPTERYWSLPALTTRVQQHFFAQAQSCVSKIQAPDLQSLILMINCDEDC
jgi:hypothetical protein